MKKVAGTLKLDQAQFRELEAFSKFGSDLDAATLNVLEKGRRNVEILKQPQYSPMKVEEQIAILFCGTNNLLLDIPSDKIRDFQESYLSILQAKYQDVLDELKQGKLTDKSVETMKKIAADISGRYKK